MKEFILYSIVFILSISCSEEEKVKQNEPILGRWQLIETYDGSEDTWVLVKDGYTLEFNEDGKIFDSRLACDVKYKIINSTEFSYIYKCGLYDINHTYKYEVENNILFLDYTKDLCIETCIEKFKRVEL